MHDITLLDASTLSQSGPLQDSNQFKLVKTSMGKALPGVHLKGFCEELICSTRGLHFVGGSASRALRAEFCQLGVWDLRHHALGVPAGMLPAQTS